MTKIVHFYPDRDCREKNNWADVDYWNYYAQAASEVGMEWILSSHDAVDIYEGEGKQQVYLSGNPISPGDTLFISDIYCLPNQHVDVWQQITTFMLLESLGFYLSIPPSLALKANDKLLTYQMAKTLALNLIPTARINTGRKMEYKKIDDLIDKIQFPMILKPASWGGGMGINAVHNRPQLDGILSLATAADVCMVAQPLLDSRSIIDYRCYVVDGKLHTTIYRKAQKDALLANISQGGISGVEEKPIPELEAFVSEVTRQVDIPYFCLDFLFDGSTFWFSEMELDGGIPLDVDRSILILKDRFKSCKERMQRHLQSAH